MTYDASEQDILIGVFVKMLRKTTKDGGRKRAAGLKPPWWRDNDHEAAIFSHLNKWKHGEKEDPDSGVHPLVHMAWRALAIAYQETYGQRDPDPLRGEWDATGDGTTARPWRGTWRSPSDTTPSEERLAGRAADRRAAHPNVGDRRTDSDWPGVVPGIPD